MQIDGALYGNAIVRNACPRTRFRRPFSQQIRPVACQVGGRYDPDTADASDVAVANYDGGDVGMGPQCVATGSGGVLRSEIGAPVFHDR